MLLQFKFKNHKCFYDETFLDLMATQEKRHIESTFNVNGNNIGCYSWCKCIWKK